MLVRSKNCGRLLSLRWVLFHESGSAVSARSGPREIPPTQDGSAHPIRQFFVSYSRQPRTSVADSFDPMDQPRCEQAILRHNNDNTTKARTETEPKTNGHHNFHFTNLNSVLSQTID